MLRVNTFILAVMMTAQVLAAEPASDAEKVTQALETWAKAKKESGGNYSYTVRFTSFIGAGSNTVITVENNKVVGRTYTPFNLRQPAPGEQGFGETKGWSEKGKELGSHKQGAPAKTLDELYADVAKIASQELPPHLRRYVRTNKEGLLISCFTVDTRIADDAPTQGLNINSITIVKNEKTSDTTYRSPSGKAYPKHWGAPPRRQTRDLRKLPGDYGRGSSTLARWIQENLDKDAEKK